MAHRRIEIPAAVIKAVSTRWPDLAPAWQETAPCELARICQQYKGHPVRTFKARYGFVVEVETTRGYLVARSTPDPMGLMQAEVSRSLSELGIGPTIFEVIQTPTSVWTVTSRIFPGDSQRGRNVPLERLAPIFRKMHDQDMTLDRLPTLANWLQSRLSGEDHSDLSPGTSPASPDDRRRAAALLTDLEASTSNRLCHGDTSSNNILRGPGRQLFLIDPRGVSGDVCYDMAVAAWKTAREERPSTRAAMLARLVGTDPDRVQAWLQVAQIARV